MKKENTENKPEIREWKDFLNVIDDIEKDVLDGVKTRLRKADLVLSEMLKTIVSKRKLTEADLDTVLKITIQKFIEAVQAQAITVYFTDDEGNAKFKYIYYSRSLYKNDPDLFAMYDANAESLKGKKLKRGMGIVGKVLTTGLSHFTINAEEEPEFYAEVDKRLGFRSKSMITVPIKVSDKVIGAIQAINKNTDTGVEPFTHHDLILLDEIADYSSKIIQKLRDPETKIDDDEIAKYIARLTKCEYIDLKTSYEKNEKLLNLVGKENLSKFRILPLKKIGNKSIKAAMANPLDLQKRDSFHLATDLDIEIVVVAPESKINEIIDSYLKKDDTNVNDAVERLGEEYASQAETIAVSEAVDEKSAPIVQIANRIIEDAYSRGSSDIHIEPFESEILVRYRVDGVLEECLRLPIYSLRPLISRYKIMSQLDITEHRLPQDGRIRFKEYTNTGIDIDLRVAIAPMAFGEKMVMRILDKQSTTVGLDVMGFSKEDMDVYRSSIHSPYGMVLHVGPTGSGKTTTLYSALSEINKPGVNIQTAEDPIEYMLKGVNQLQVNKDIGLTFAAALRSYLRQDPDVIMVGEIRDKETAEIAVEAALTGHLMFSTLHTNDAVGTVVRFLDMGIQSYMISSSLLCIVAQRLMRKLCKCKIQYNPTESEIGIVKAQDNPDLKLYKTRGCAICSNKGFKGRIGVYEVLRPTEEVRALINKEAASEVLEAAAVRGGMNRLLDDALYKVRNGVTSLQEALRVVRTE
ncbi:MAG: GspE/PulE family protein [Planctomycetota bacterium]